MDGRLVVVPCLGSVGVSGGRTDVPMKRGWAVCAAASAGRHGPSAARGDSGAIRGRFGASDSSVLQHRYSLFSFVALPRFSEGEPGGRRMSSGMRLGLIVLPRTAGSWQRAGRGYGTDGTTGTDGTAQKGNRAVVLRDQWKESACTAAQTRRRRPCPRAPKTGRDAAGHDAGWKQG